MPYNIELMSIGVSIRFQGRPLFASNLEKETAMGDLFLLSERQMARISSHFPLSHGVPRVDDRRVVSGVV